MYKSLIIKIIIAIFFAVMASVLTVNLINDEKMEIEVIVAKEEINVGDIFSNDNIKVVSINEKILEYYPNIAFNKESIIDGVSMGHIEKDHFIEITPSTIMFDDEKTYALNLNGKVKNSYFIPKDMRIIAVEVDSTGSLNHSIDKGDYVDLVYTSEDNLSGGIYSSIILQHLEIFDIEEIETEEGESLSTKQNVLLLATPEDVPKIAVANRTGTIDLVLNPLSGETQKIDPVHILTFAAEQPMSYEERLAYIYNFIIEQDITETSKDKLVKDINYESEMALIKELIINSDVDDDTKTKLLEIIEK